MDGPDYVRRTSSTAVIAALSQLPVSVVLASVAFMIWHFPGGDGSTPAWGAWLVKVFWLLLLLPPMCGIAVAMVSSSDRWRGVGMGVVVGWICCLPVTYAVWMAWAGRVMQLD